VPRALSPSRVRSEPSGIVVVVVVVDDDFFSYSSVSQVSLTCRRLAALSLHVAHKLGPAVSTSLSLSLSLFTRIALDSAAAPMRAAPRRATSGNPIDLCRCRENLLLTLCFAATGSSGQALRYISCTSQQQSTNNKQHR
jgi:hypothetical protein